MTANRFNNLNRLSVKISAIGRETQREVSRAVRRSGLRIENRAAEGIAEPPKTGRIYRRGKIVHQASAPGEFPAGDTGRLQQSLTSVMAADGPDVFRAETGANAPYATYLELGTSSMEPRPFLKPAYEETKAKNLDEIRAAIARGARSGVRG